MRMIKFRCIQSGIALVRCKQSESIGQLRQYRTWQDQSSVRDNALKAHTQDVEASCAQSLSTTTINSQTDQVRSTVPWNSHTGVYGISQNNSKLESTPILAEKI
jgi:hypothetical protein